MTITNPRSLTKTFTTAEFYSYCLQVEKRSEFQEWAKNQHAQVRVGDGCGVILDTDKVSAYLREVGYQIS